MVEWVHSSVNKKYEKCRNFFSVNLYLAYNEIDINLHRVESTRYTWEEGPCFKKRVVVVVKFSSCTY